MSSGLKGAKLLKKRSMREKKKWAEDELRSRPARLRFWEMDPRDKPEDDSVY